MYMMVFPSYSRAATKRQGGQLPCLRLFLAVLALTLAAALPALAAPPAPPALSAFAAPHAPTDTARTLVPFTGPHTSWHGFDRYDFLMDESTGDLQPTTAAADVGNAVGPVVKGQRHCIIVVPQTPAKGNPWSWQACYWDHQPQAEVELLKRGWCIAFINPEPDPLWDK